MEQFHLEVGQLADAGGQALPKGAAGYIIPQGDYVMEEDFVMEGDTMNQLDKLSIILDDLGADDLDARESFTDALIRAVARAIQNRIGSDLTEDRAIGAAEEVYNSVLVHLLLKDP